MCSRSDFPPYGPPIPYRDEWADGRESRYQRPCRDCGDPRGQHEPVDDGCCQCCGALDGTDPRAHFHPFRATNE